MCNLFFYDSINFFDLKWLLFLFLLMGIIKLYVPAVEAKPGPPLAPILGQHQVNLIEFCKEFNKLSSGWTPSLPLPVKVTKLEGNRFSIKVNSPTIHFLLNQILEENRMVGVEKLFDLLLIRDLNSDLSQKDEAKLLFGFLNSKRIKIRL